MGWANGVIGRRTFKFWALSAVLVVSMAALAGGIAFGTTTDCSNPATLGGSAFEVDPAPPPATNTGANLIVNTTGCIDWLTGGTGTGLRSGVVAKNDTTSGPTDESFGNGTKEDTANPSIVDGGIPPNKSDLKAFGVYPEQGTVTTSNPTGKFLALFWTRVQDPSGTTNMDFELNQKFCGPAPTFTDCAGNHITPLRTGDGAGPLTDDKLITYDLSNGGTVATISIRSWSGSAWGSPTVISGGANANALGSINTSSIPANQAGGATNGLTTQLGPLSPRTFGEATISFSALFGSNTCSQFGSAYLKSRSSDTFTSALKDFVPPTQVSISNCAALTTNASNPASNPATIGSPISDTATLSGVSPNAGGTITFKLYSDAQCQNEVTTGLQPVTVNGPGNYNSGNFIPTAVGTYFWIASYSGDASNQPASGKCGDANESSVVGKKQPTISTNASNPASDPATIGSPISDTASLGNVTADAGGTITFKLYSDAQCNNQVTTGLQPVTVNGPGNYNSGNFIPTAVGTYFWIASYSGDAKNEAVSGQCGDANESSVVGKKQPAIVTNASNPASNPAIVGSPISDTATLSGATDDAGGTITFKLYSDAQCNNQVTTGLQAVTVSGNGDYESGNFTPSAPGTYFWIASYSGDAKNQPISGACGDANESSVVVKKQPAIETNATASVTIGEPISDTATLSGATDDAGGTITFKLYSDAQCNNQVTTGLQAVTVSGNGDYESGNFTPSAPGTYFWIASYSGDAKNEAVSGQCGDANESSVVGKAAANIDTAQELFPQDSATLSSEIAGETPTGTVDFALYGPNDTNCSGTAVYTEENVDLTSGVANTDNTSFSVDQADSGNYKWIVHYDGDATHNEAASECGKEAFTATIDNDTTN